jgi:hypothetical protein
MNTNVRPSNLDFVNTASFYPVIQQWFFDNIVSQSPLLVFTRHEMMSLTSYGEQGKSVNVNLPISGLNSPSDIVPSTLDSQSTTISLSSHRQALVPTRAHSAPAEDPNHVVKTNLSDTAPKRTHVKRDRSKMKCTRCVMRKRGCDGGRPQCENCRRSNMKCEWVGGEVTR